MLLLALGTCEARAAASAAEQINFAVETHLRQALELEAKRQGWQGLRVSHATDLPPRAASLSPCSRSLRVRPTGPAASPLDRQRLEVSCPGTGGWSLSLNSQANALLPAAHALGIIERGQTIGAGDVKLEPLNIARANRGFFNRLEEVVGMDAKRRIRPNQLLTPALLAETLAVRRGQPVKIVASQDGIEASASGEALADGRPGDVIRVRNLRSQNVIDAKVVEDGVVSSTF
ncbi:flagellar basal body P-ring formation chaperone FlgA [Stutzerimonas azotifigens]|uniref:flagellar basal body P-ring formation chaperone FlgA n=1 Tax=Stutzerimonas azotifigens TaxID=291995 RepID=UPI002159538B|nr:flagellar basal body P-ring formation chaperone FlgA [Stutzerimonas azotifigens]